MTPQELAKKTILAQQNRTNTDFKEITHRGVTLKTRVEFGDFRKVNKDEDKVGKQIEDEISFLDVDASFVSRGDDITFENTTYYIEYFIPSTLGLYNIFCTETRRTGSGTGKRR